MEKGNEFEQEYSKTWKPSKFRPAQLLKPSFYKSQISKNKKLSIALLCLIILSLFTSIPLLPHYKALQTPKIVIILAVNEGGGVQKWKGPQEWSVERSSIKNKLEYANLHGYQLALKDITTKRRYSHEWREGWEKADIMKQAMREYPDAEWFWWLDLHTFIMEPQIALEDYLLNDIENTAYRTLHHLNPLDIPLDSLYVDVKNSPVNMILAQDCGGFNLGSFFLRRSNWTDMLLDTWWDPVLYEQMHMIWEHQEQDALETLYATQPWIREGLGFVPLRAINSFPEGACEDFRDDPQYFYSDKDRDFVVNMAGCNWGRSCWDEMEKFKELSKELHKSHWYKFW